MFIVTARRLSPQPRQVSLPVSRSSPSPMPLILSGTTHNMNISKSLRRSDIIQTLEPLSRRVSQPAPHASRLAAVSTAASRAARRPAPASAPALRQLPTPAPREPPVPARSQQPALAFLTQPCAGPPVVNMHSPCMPLGTPPVPPLPVWTPAAAQSLTPTALPR